ncbi:hypothetical protein L7F22_058890, partial [Adiantum nelumboides]|nr:hypothetical protein [Adiantum nelumboides]
MGCLGRLHQRSSGVGEQAGGNDGGGTNSIIGKERGRCTQGLAMQGMRSGWGPKEIPNDGRVKAVNSMEQRGGAQRLA